MFQVPCPGAAASFFSAVTQTHQRNQNPENRNGVMERLIFSTPLPSKTPPNPILPLPRIARFDAGKLGFSPILPSDSRPFASIFSKSEDSSPFFSHSRRVSLRFAKKSNFEVAPLTGRSPGVDRFPESSGERDSGPLLRKAISVGTIILLSALVGILTQSIVLAPPVYATLQTAAKTGSSAAAVGGRLVRSELLSSAWTGFFAGCLHTLSGPDHLAALAPLSIGRTQMESAAVGALWGCGHDAGQLIFGLLFLLLKDRLHIEVIRTWGTRVVGLTLLVIGAMGIREASEIPTPCVALENGDCDVSVVESIETGSGGKKKIGFATFATGIVHGLQPDALMMVLPALALPSRLAGAAFLGMFLLGTVVAMGSYTVFIGSCSQALKERIPRITEKLTWASSLVAISLGIAILISQLFGFSLY